MLALAISQCFAMQAQTLPEVSLLRQDTAEVVLPWPVNVQTRLDSLMTDPLLERTQLGLMVYDLSADSALYCHGAQQTLRPASTMKLLTSVTALDLLGSGYAFRTYLYYKGTIAQGVLTGDVWLVGGMDPLFDEKDMHIFAETLHRVGVDTIRGRIMQDISFKEEQLLGEGWCWDDENPQLTPLLISGKDEFASQLNVTPKYLSMLLKETMNRRPSDMIHLFTLKAIEHRLRFTDMSIQEIANDLKFPNASFFGTYFKAHTGMTPMEYRRKYHNGK